MKFVVGKPPTAKQFLINLQEKKSSDLFNGDMEGLLRGGVVYHQDEAFEWITNEIVEKL